MSLVVASVLEVEAYGARLLRLEHEQCQVWLVQHGMCSDGYAILFIKS